MTMDVCGYNVPLWLVLGLLALFAYYKYLTWNHGLFKTIGVKGPTPLPVVGNTHRMLKEGIVKYDADLIEKYGRVVGFFQGRDPNMIVADADMLKQILVKRFDCFQNRRGEPLYEFPLSLMLTSLKDDHWKHVRCLMSPTFSTGKLKQMNGLINHSGEILVKNLTAKAEKNEVVEFIQTAGYYVMDVIGSTSFGLLIDSQSDPENELIQQANKAIAFQMPKWLLIIFLIMPGLRKYLGKLGVDINFPMSVSDYFIRIVKNAINARDSEKEKRVDLLQQMLKVRSGDVTGDIGGIGGDISHLALDKSEVWNKKALSEDEIMAQSILFFLAGYSTTSAMISFLTYTLALNPDCQETLIEEIDRVMEGHSEPSYSLVQKMTYLEMCIQETLRIYPGSPRFTRHCQKDVTINGQLIPEGVQIIVPVQWFHHNPSIWPDPEAFKPERFSPGEKAASNPLYHMPFGYGPRSCIAMRLALFECKMCMVHILQNFRIVTCEETQIPLDLDKFRQRPQKGIRLKLQKRSKESTAV